MGGNEYRDLVAAYIDANFRDDGLAVYTEVQLGKTIIGKNRRIDIFLVRETDNSALAIECKYQAGSGTTDEKIPYALQDLAALRVPGCLCYAGSGWSKGVLHTLEASPLAVSCNPDLKLLRDKSTLELDHVIAAEFGLWNKVIHSNRRFNTTPVQAMKRLPTQRAKRLIPPFATEAQKVDK